ATTRIRNGGILYLDELPGARPNAMTVVYSMTDHRRTLTVDDLDEQVFVAPDNFMVVAAWNPKYHNRKMIESLPGRFWHIPLDYQPPEREAKIIQEIAQVDKKMAFTLAQVGDHIRGAGTGIRSKGADLSTGQLIKAAKLIKRDHDPVVIIKRLPQSLTSYSVENKKNFDEALEGILHNMGV
ncbi:MAG: AAA family ATPase, partial [Nanoarchaeota archaeon]